MCGTVGPKAYEESNWCLTCVVDELIEQERIDDEHEFPELIGYLRSA